MLAHIITPANRALYGRLLTEIFRQRHQVFVEKRKWKLASHNGLERDELDDLPTVIYHAVVDERGVLIASNRFVPGDGPTLSAGPLLSFWQRPIPCDPHSWEVSRTITAPNADFPKFAESNASVWVGAIEWAFARGIRRIFGVGDSRFVGGMVNVGWEVEPHGLPVDYPEGGRGVAVSWPVTAKTLADTRRAFGFRRPFIFEAPPQLEPRELTASEHAFLNLVAETQTPTEREAIVSLCGTLQPGEKIEPIFTNGVANEGRHEAA